MVEITQLIAIAEQAGQIILSYYNRPLVNVTQKTDKSLLTEADLHSHHFIIEELFKCYPMIPVISEESVTQYGFEERQKWDCFFLVDPLDGTKEFVERNNEFTVNIALIKNGRPVMGVIHAPALALTYYAEESKGAYKIEDHEHKRLPLQNKEAKSLRVVVSRSHRNEKTQQFLDKLLQQGETINMIAAGSAIKFALVAEGVADIYPRLSPTMEWDTAAGDILATETGKMLKADDGLPLQYNKQELVNPGFVMQ